MFDLNETNLVIYHADCSDGFGAAYAAWKILGNRAEYIACVHGDPPPDVTDKNVVVLDFSFDKETTKKLIAAARNFLIIDHHKSAMIELHDCTDAHFDMSKSGAILSWEHFHPGEDPPKFLLYVQDRDLWKWSLSYSREFCAAFDIVAFDFDEYDKFCDDSVFDDAVSRGSYILAYSKTVIKKVAQRAAARKFCGFNAMVVNSPHWISEIGNHLSHSCDVAIIWFFDHEKQETAVSLRSSHEDVDVSEIAKKFGGGGHKVSAGFRWKAAIEDLFDESFKSDK